MDKELRILVLEDDPEDLELIEDTLTSAGIKFTTNQVDTREEFIEALGKNDSDVVLSDHFLPTFNSNEALSIFRQSGIPIPFILVTGAVSEEFAVETMKQGADDYVLKSNLGRLPSAILNAIEQREAMQAKATAEKSVQADLEEQVKAYKQLDTFVYSVSHNLRAPLLSVQGLVSLAKAEDSARDSHLGAYFKMIEESIQRLDDTLKEILEYSRNARQAVTLEQFDIRSLISDVLESLKFMPGASRISKHLMIDGPTTITSDRYRIEAIISNIVSNAIKYSDENKSDSFLRIFVHVNENKLVMVFADNGIGIDSQYTSKIFGMFFRATKANQGSGLGLYIVNEAVHRLHGNIHVESQIQRGSTFHVEIPLNHEITKSLDHPIT